MNCGDLQLEDYRHHHGLAVHHGFAVHHAARLQGLQQITPLCAPVKTFLHTSIVTDARTVGIARLV